MTAGPAVVLAEGQVWRSERRGVVRDVVITGWNDRYIFGVPKGGGRRTRITRGNARGGNRNGGPEGYSLVEPAPEAATGER